MLVETCKIYFIWDRRKVFFRENKHPLDGTANLILQKNGRTTLQLMSLIAKNKILGKFEKKCKELNL